MRGWIPFACAVAALCAVVGACEPGRDAPVGITPNDSAGGGGSGGLFDAGTGGECTQTGVCGSEIHELDFDAPNVYFVLDRSGSMADPAPGTTVPRFEIVRDGAKAMVADLGALIRVGAAVFPLGDLSEDACEVGGEVLGVRPGGDGVAEEFAAATSFTPSGGTPIAATLETLRPGLADLEGDSLVLLLTDGGPNCNADITCDVDDCIPNIEGLCAPDENCCAASHPEGGPWNCLDRADSIEAVEALAAAGLDVYVIGIPGSEAYGDLLDDMAVAGGTARSGEETKHHRVTDLAGIGEVFKTIAAAQISCEIPVTDPPETEGLTNVYFDCEAVAFDATDGWSWKDPSTRETVVLHGQACEELESGGVSEVHVATGCPTEVPR